MKNLSRKDDLAFTGQGMGKTPRMDKAFKECGNTPRMNWQASQCYEEGCRLERELNQAIRERDQARLNVKPMGAVTIARNGYREEIQAQRDQAIKERDAWFGLAQKLRDLLAPLAWLQAVTHPNRAEIAVAEFDAMNESQSSCIDSIYEEMEHCCKERDAVMKGTTPLPSSRGVKESITA